MNGNTIPTRQFKHYPVFNGIAKDVPARLITDDKVQAGSNIIFKDGRIKRRFGYKNIGSTLGNPIVGLFYVEFISYASNHLVAFTTRDAYRFNFSTGNWDFITQCLTSSAGKTVTVVGGSTTSTVTYTGTFDTTRLDKANIYQIMFDSTDPNSGGTWYNVVSVSSGSLLITGVVNKSAGTTFCLRICYSGEPDNYFFIAQPYDFEIKDKILVATNGVDPVQRWDALLAAGSYGTFYDVFNTVYVEGRIANGDATVFDTDTTLIRHDMVVTVVDDNLFAQIPADTKVLTEDAAFSFDTFELTKNALASGTVTLKCVGVRIDKAAFIGFYGSIGYEHTVLANTTSASEGNNQQRIQVSAAGMLVFEGTYYDLITNTEPIKGILPLQGRLMVYKDKSITEMIPNPSGGNDDPFSFNQNKINNIGTPSIRSVADVGQYHIFFGQENIYAFDGINIVPIGSDIITEMRASMNRPYDQNIFAGMLQDEDLYCLFSPYGSTDGVLNQFANKCYVYDYKLKTWSMWDFNMWVTAMAPFRKEVAPAWSEKIDGVGGLDATETTDGIATVRTSCTTHSGTAVLDCADTSNIVAGMNVRGTGIPRKTTSNESVKVLSVVTNVSVTINVNAIANGTVNIRFIGGLDADESTMRFEDLILYSNNIGHVIGDSTGGVYMLDHSYDDDNGTDILATFTTKDYPLNDPKMNFKLLSSVISFLTNNGSYIKIRASVNFGETWTDWVNIPMDGTSDYKEYLVNYLDRGRQVRFEVANIDSSYFEIESLLIEYSDMGISRDY